MNLQMPQRPMRAATQHLSEASQQGDKVHRYLGQIPPGAFGGGAWPLLPLSPPSPGSWSFYLCCFLLKMSSRCGKAYFLSL